MRLLRLALQAVLFFLVVAAVIAIGAAETGALEKLVIAVIAGGLVWVAAHVRRLGSPDGPHSA